MDADLIVTNIGQLITCASRVPKRGAEMLDLGIITEAAVAIQHGKFVGVGRADEIAAAFSAAQIADADGMAVIPGFVDPHTHIVFAGDRLDEFEMKIQGRDYLEILEKGGGIISTVRRTREASFEELVELSRKRLDKMLACGTTTAEIKTGYGLETETELKMLRVIEELDLTHPIDLVPTFLAAHAIPPEFKVNSDGYIELVCTEMLPRAWEWYQASHFSANGVPFFADVFCEKNAFGLDQSRRVLEAARSLGFRVKAHVDQFTNLGGSGFGIALNAASIDHLDEISVEEIEQLAKSETVGVVIPTENFSAGKTRFANARRMVDTGCAVAISTDYNPGSAPCPSQPMAMAIASRYQKLLPSECLNAATVNAAFGIGMENFVGSIETGKIANLLILDSPDFRSLVYEFGGDLIRTKLSRGVVV